MFPEFGFHREGQGYSKKNNSQRLQHFPQNNLPVKIQLTFQKISHLPKLQM